MYFLNKYVVHIVILIMLACSSNMKWGGDYWKGTIGSDGKGYYAYLPAVFIYNELNFSFIDEIEEKYYDHNTRYDFRSYINGKAFSKYSMGVALLMLPFFLAAHFFSLIFGYSPDGYSQPYNIAVCLATIFYLGVGLTYLKKILSVYKIHDNIRTITILLYAFGTNLFYYTLNEPALSHIYSFAMITMFVYYSKIFFKTGLYRYFLIASFIFGCIILIRQVNLLVILALPFIAGEWDVFRNTLVEFVKSFKKLAVAVFLPLIFISLQWWFYYMQTATWLPDPYIGESFYFTNPYFFQILFSYKKGLFLYMPMLLFSFAGLLFLYKRNRFETIAFVVFFVLLTYILSSWWCWYYGGSFGLRAYVEFYALFAVLLAVFLAGVKTKIYKVLAISVLVLLGLVCQVQTYQYRYYQIHWSEMNKEKYWDVFLRIDKLVKK